MSQRLVMKIFSLQSLKQPEHFEEQDVIGVETGK